MALHKWKDHYAAAFEMTDSSGGFEQYRIGNQTGTGTVTACTVFSGIQILYNDLKMGQCSTVVKQNKSIIEMSFCLEGRYENFWNDRYSFILSAGDFSVGFAGRKEGGGSFPLERYQGIVIFLDTEAFSGVYPNILRELEISLDGIMSIASRQPHYFKVQRNEELNMVLYAIVGSFSQRNIPRLRIKVLELLLFLSRSETAALGGLPVYLNKRNVALAKSVHTALTQDLSRHLTLEQLAEELGSGTTLLKRSFKIVYGVSIYQYLKDLRLQEAQRQLRETDFPVSAIAFSVGYANPAKFSSAFKERFGISPTAFRAQKYTL